MNSDIETERRAYFDALYAENPDPWRYDDCAYEIEKRADTLAFLRPHYQSGCEMGCSIGVLTEALAPRCDHLVGVDISTTAAEAARERLKSRTNIEIRVMHLPHQPLEGRFDLFVLSEVLYFLDEAELEALALIAADHVVPAGDLIIVSYDGETQTRLNGLQTTNLFLKAASRTFDLICAEQRPDYHVRLLRRRYADV